MAYRGKIFHIKVGSEGKIFHKKLALNIFYNLSLLHLFSFGQDVHNSSSHIDHTYSRQHFFFFFFFFFFYFAVFICEEDQYLNRNSKYHFWLQ